MSVLSNFKDFITKGNVVDLAVGVLVGAAFSDLVKAFTDKIIQPFINAVGPSDIAQGLGFQLKENGNQQTFVDIGAFISSIIYFIVLAAIIYFIFVVPLKKIRERRGISEESEKAEELILLAEIRDSLRRGA